MQRMYVDILKKMKQNLKIMKLKEKWEGKCHNRIPLDYLTSKVDQHASQNRRGHLLALVQPRAC